MGSNRMGYFLAGWSSRQLREVYRAALLGWGHMTCWPGGRLPFSYHFYKSYLLCSPPRPFLWVSGCILAPGTLLYPLNPFFFFFCSRGWGLCLDDPPAKDVIDFPSVLPGVLYDVNHQCRLQYGAYSVFCEDMDVSMGMGGRGGGPHQPENSRL